MKKEQIELISFDDNSALISFWSEEYQKVKIEVFANSQFLKNIETIEFATIGRVEITQLPADSEIMLNVIFDNYKSQLNFRTLKNPKGKLLSSFAIVSDLHISERLENRKGRMFVESSLLFSEILQTCKELKLDFMTISGDLTNDGTPKEFEMLKNILKPFDIPIIAGIGDHDVMCSTNLWKNLLDEGVIQNQYQNQYLNVYALDTADSQLKQSDAEYILEMQKKEQLSLLVTHVHLLQNDMLSIGQKAKGIKNADQYSDFFSKLSQKDTIILAGHQNIQSIVKQNFLTQINIPQPCQYPCSWIYAKLYSDELRLKIMPIKSEVLRYYSDKEANLAANLYGEKQWETTYRQGVGAVGINISIPLKTFGETYNK